ncbi:MAG: DUF2878 domain-containing protein [Luminiphilus sp.]|jgi:hypothetical protein|nr:DUF2878 domain-containing protein [Luminiphilus sp.]
MILIEKTWFNAVWFQTTWFSCVLGREDWMLLTAALIAFHYAAVSNIRLELRRVLPATAMGVGVDVTLAATGVYDFGGVFFPLWMVCLWLVFPTVLPRAMAFLAATWWRPVVLGAIAPLNYLAGAKFGAVALPLGDVTSMMILVPLWMVMLPLMVRFSQREATVA